MRVQLLGTGAADGWPNPFCGCASCLGALSRGEIRSQTSALVDGTLLLDCGPETPRNALRLGVSLRDVRAVLITHAHPDHFGPAFLMWRGWVEKQRALHVYAPAAVIAECRQWLRQSEVIELHEVRAGEVHELDGGYVVRVLPARHGEEAIGPALLYDLTAPDGSRLLYATDTAALPDAALVSDAAYDLVLMEETWGTVSTHGTDHLDLTTWPLQVSRLRQAGAITEQTRLVAVHLGHRNPPTAELAAQLSAWGGEVHPDGAVIEVGTDEPAGPRAGGRTLVLGGARSGKSTFAESMLAAESHVTYVATSGIRSGDPEWDARVAAHQLRRPPNWTTLETTDLATVLGEASADDALLVDCLTLWLTAVMDDAGSWTERDWEPPVTAAVDTLVEALRATKARVVLVSNEVGSGVVPQSSAGRRFRDALGVLNSRTAGACEHVVLVTAGIPQRLR